MRQARHRGRAGTWALVCVLVSATASAHEARRLFDMSGSYTIIGQTSDDRGSDDSVTGSLDVYFDWRRDRLALEVYVEANTSLDDDGVASRFPRSNADAGTALDPDRSGRVQISELKLSRDWARGASLSAGLIDASVYLDTTRINNDENLQFLGSSFVNNPTIEFPDYTLGLAGKLRTAASRPAWTLVLAGSNGLADNPNLSYGQLLNLTADAKGLFAGAEVAWPSVRFPLRGGLWLNTASHETLDGERDDASNHGAYAAIGATKGALALNLRAGLARRDVSLAERFASLVVQRELGRQVLGVAVARTWLSPEAALPVTDHTTHLEAYVRFALGRELYLTPSIQQLVDSAFDSSARVGNRRVLVYSLRLHHVFWSRE